MTASICWVHIGDLHMDEADGWLSRDRLDAIVREMNEHVGDQADFVFLPGDNANHATFEQYRKITEGLTPLRLPWRAIPGDHDFELGDLANFEDAFPERNRPEVEVIAGHRCIFLDIVSAGAGGPDFRISMHHRNRLSQELTRAHAEEQTPLVFMHAYPGDLAADADEVAQVLADGRVAFVDTGHTHYGELLNDGRVIYGATRSTGQIEEGNGAPGYAIVCVHDGVPSWRFKELGGNWPFIQIISPVDVHLITDPCHHHQVCRPGLVKAAARRFGVSDEPMIAVIDGGYPQPMTQEAGGVWTAMIELDQPGLHQLTVRCGEAEDAIDVLVRGVESIPKRRPPVALGHACHAIGAWPRAGLLGTQLGPNRNGQDW